MKAIPQRFTKGNKTHKLRAITFNRICRCTSSSIHFYHYHFRLNPFFLGCGGAGVVIVVFGSFFILLIMRRRTVELESCPKINQKPFLSKNNPAITAFSKLLTW